MARAFWEEHLREGAFCSAEEQKFKGEADLPWHPQPLAPEWKGQWVLDTTMGIGVRGCLGLGQIWEKIYR